MTVIEHFQWPGGMTLQIESAAWPHALEREIGSFRILPQPNHAADAQIVYCRSPKEIPAGNAVHQGTYKGIAWKIAQVQSVNGKPRYYFYAPAFKTFLFVRTCLIPILKKEAVENGGFLIIGSAFAYDSKTVVLFGKPGSGKTRFLLDALKAGAAFLGDSELRLTHDRRVLPVFPYLEARLKTVYGTAHWQRLSFRDKAYLWFCHILSGVSGGKIAFNLLLNAVDVKNSAQTQAGRLIFVCLVSGMQNAQTLQTEEFLAAVESYETGYQKLFGAEIYTPQLRVRGLQQLSGLLSSAQLYKISGPAALQDFLKQENQKI